MTQPQASAFLGQIEQIETGHPGTVLLHAPFDLTQFHDRLFADFGVTCPDQLSSAIDKRRADFLAGRALVAQAFAALGLPPDPIGMGADRAPLWPARVIGSISHTHSRCACILSTDTTLRVGLDIERPLDANSDKAVQKHTLHAAERALIADHPDAPLLAGLIFSAKETLFKALYPTVQHFFGFDAAEMRSLPDQNHLQLHLTTTLHPTLAEGRDFNIRYTRLPDQILTWLID